MSEKQTVPKSSRYRLWLLVALCVAPIVASYAIFFIAPPLGVTSYGELLEPRVLPDPQLRLADGTAFRLSSLRGKWVLLTVDSGHCDEFCRVKLYNMRQLRLTQGKDKNRIERALLMSDEVPVQQDLAAGFQGTWLVRAAGTSLLRELPAQANVADHIYVVDPLGNVMLRYPRDADARRIIKDLARLLKASRIG